MASAEDARNGAVLVAQTVFSEMASDESVVVFGEDVGSLGGVFGATRKLQATYGRERVFDTPISETAFLGMAVGAAQAGLRPIVELMFVDFLGVCFDQIANQMAKNHYMSGGEVAVPLVLRAAVGSIGSAAQHSQVLGATFAHFPGLRVVMPASPNDLQGMLVSAIRCDDPVVFLEHKQLLKTRAIDLAFNDAQTPGTPIQPTPLTSCRRLRGGHDVTIVAAGWMVQESIRAADTLALEGTSVGVVDIRSLAPLDRDGLAEHASAATRLLIVDDDYLRYGMSGEIAISIVERLGGSSPLIARHGLDISQPASRVLEQFVLPSAESIANHIRTWGA